jgi:L-alanine-DL-glutamate epimerase-like enolase superfamily enzyme
MLVGETQETCFEAAKDFSKILIGKNPLAIEDRMLELETYLVHNTTLKSAFDMALYDLLGKYTGLPLYRLLGGEKRSMVTDETIGIGDPVSMAKKALVLKQIGVPAIKIKLGTNRRDDVERVQAIRKAIGNELPIRIDANQGWDYVTAVGVLNDIADMGVQYCEEPVKHWNNMDLKLVRQNSQIPIMADESVFDHHDAFRLASMGACDYFNIKLAKSGGINKALKVNAVAEAAGIKCMIGSMGESRLGISASAHFYSARTNLIFVDLDPPFGHKMDPVKGGVKYNGYELILSDEPGLGADIEEGFLNSCEKA